MVRAALIENSKPDHGMKAEQSQEKVDKRAYDLGEFGNFNWRWVHTKTENISKHYLYPNILSLVILLFI